MKFIKQFGIIMLISFVGEVLNSVIPLPVPASIYGFVIMFACLKLKIIKISSVHETGKFLIEIMPLMFIPAAVGLITAWKVLKPMFVPVAVITVVSTIVVMAVSGRVTQDVITHKAKHKVKNEEHTDLKAMAFAGAELEEGGAE